MSSDFYEIQTDEDKIFRLFRQIRLSDYTLVYSLQKDSGPLFLYIDSLQVMYL